jgi:hypothetical protein
MTSRFGLFDDAAAADSSVVHEDVDRAERGEKVVEQIVDGGPVVHVQRTNIDVDARFFRDGGKIAPLGCAHRRDDVVTVPSES